MNILSVEHYNGSKTLATPFPPFLLRSHWCSNHVVFSKQVPKLWNRVNKRLKNCECCPVSLFKSIICCFVAMQFLWYEVCVSKIALCSFSLHVFVIVFVFAIVFLLVMSCFTPLTAYFSQVTSVQNLSECSKTKRSLSHSLSDRVTNWPIDCVWPAA